jgi:uncharacterized protein DUF3617
MTNARQIIFITCAALVTAPANAAGRIIQIEPGLWEYSHNLTIPGILAPSETAKTECISPEDAKLNLSDLLARLAAGDAKCTVTNLKDTLNTVKFDIACRPELESMKITSSGKAAFRYSRTKISGSVSGMMQINQGEDIFLYGEGTAHRIGRCPD